MSIARRLLCFSPTLYAYATVLPFLSSLAAGYAMDTLCYNNFIVGQQTNNGGPGLAPDRVCRTCTPVSLAEMG